MDKRIEENVDNIREIISGEVSPGVSSDVLYQIELIVGKIKSNTCPACERKGTVYRSSSGNRYLCSYCHAVWDNEDN